MLDQLEASNQVMAVFRSMAPLLDRSLQLEDNPGLQKRQRKEGAAKAPLLQQSQVDLAKAMTLMAKLLIKQDQEIQAIRREDTFLLFF